MGKRENIMEYLSFYRGKRVLLTGHTGFKGMWLTLLLLRAGADIRMECLGCGHLLMLPRNKVEKNIRKVKEQRKPLVADQGRAEV